MSFLPVIPALLSRCIAMSCGPCGDDGVPGAEEKTGSASDLSLGVKLALTKRLGSSLFHRYWARTHEGTVVAGNPKFVSAAEVCCWPLCMLQGHVCMCTVQLTKKKTGLFTSVKTHCIVCITGRGMYPGQRSVGSVWHCCQPTRYHARPCIGGAV